MIATRAGRSGLIRRHARRGVTYIELLVAVSVMGILAALVLPTGLKVSRRADEAQLKRSLVKIRAAIDEYHQDWELGYIESDNEHGWPDNLEMLTEEIEYWGPRPGREESGPADPSSPGGGGLNVVDDLVAEPFPKVYLRRIPQDPFNELQDDWDTGGWKARSYEDDFDSYNWGGEGVYDVYSSSDRLSLDGETRYEEW